MKRGQRSPEATKRYKQLQRRKKRYMELREELQLAGEIPVEPDGAVRDERVDPASQGAQPLPELVLEAIRRGWDVPEAKKPGLVDEMVAIVESSEATHKSKITAFAALRLGDKDQYERDHPAEKAKEGHTTVTVVNNNSVQLGNVFDDIERDIRLIEGKEAGNLPADGTSEPLDAPQADRAEAQPEAD